jgi:aminoglycoside 2'-N-acetyltransferase I
MPESLAIQVIPSRDLTPAALSEILTLCNLAFEEDLAPLFALYADPVHVLGSLAGELVSHAMWVTRWLQQADGPLLHTAYVEWVATHPDHQRRGFAGALMNRLASEVSGYDLSALSPATVAFYARLGWLLWRGPLSIRQGTHRLPTPDEAVMVLPLARSPALDLDAPLSAEWREGELW